VGGCLVVTVLAAILLCSAVVVRAFGAVGDCLMSDVFQYVLKRGVPSPQSRTTASKIGLSVTVFLSFS
jgi:hypothetical protein